MTNLGGIAFASPVVAWNPGLSKTAVYTANEVGVVAAYDQASGLPVWSHSLGAPIRSTPLAEGRYLWVAPTHGGRLYKLDAATGATVCSTPVVDVYQESINASPVLATPPGGSPTIYVGVNDVGSHNGPLTAIHEADCSITFKASSEPSPGSGGIWDFVSYGVSASGEGLVLYGTADPDSAIYANDAVTGKLVWRHAVANPSPGLYDVGAGVVVSPPGANGFAHGVAYVESKLGIMYALDLTTGAPIWTHDFASSSLSTAALSGTDLVFGSETAGVFDLDAVTGVLRWRHDDSAGLDSSPAIVGPVGHQVVVYGDYAGRVTVLSLANGSVSYTYQTGGYIVGSVAETDGNIVELAGDGFLYDLAVGGSNVAMPLTSVITPADHSTVANPHGYLTISGTAAATTPLSAVTVGIQAPDGRWWDSATSTWTAAPHPNPATLSAPGAMATSWSTSFPAPAAGGSYTALASAVSLGQADVSVGKSSPTPARSTFAVRPSATSPSLTLSSGFAPLGGTITVRGTGFGAGESVDISLGSVSLGRARASSAGTLPPTVVTIPTVASFGPGSLVATGATSKRVSTALLYISNAWNDYARGPGHQAYDPNDGVFTGRLSVGPSTFLVPAWSFDAGAPVSASVDVFDGIAYIASQAGRISAVDVATAAPVWSISTPSQAPVKTTPALTTNGLLVAVTSTGVAAYQRDTGRQAWSVSLPGTSTAPTALGSTIFIGSDRGTLSAIDDSTGATLWSKATGGAVTAPPAADPISGLVVVGDSSGQVSAVKAATGATVWKAQLGSAATSAADIAGGEIYVGTANGGVHALAETNGSTAWTFLTKGAITADIAFDGVDVVVGSADGTLYYLHAASGAVHYTVSEGQPVVGVAGAGNFFVATGARGSVHGSKPANTDPDAWLTTLGTSLGSAPTVVNGEVFVAGLNGMVTAYTVPGHVVY